MSKPQRRSPGNRAERPSEELVLAALERAARHRAGETPAAPIWTILDHLAVSRRSSAARQVRAMLAELYAAGRVEPSRPHGVEAWALTGAGRRRLRRAQRAGSPPPLPESPQHREWRAARTAATQEIERFERALRRRLQDAALLIDAGRPVASDAWFELAESLRRACRNLGSAGHCLYEWPEPHDELADIDSREEPGDAQLAPPERDRRRALRMGRRNVTLWQDG